MTGDEEEGKKQQEMEEIICANHLWGGGTKTDWIIRFGRDNSRVANIQKLLINCIFRTSYNQVCESKTKK